MKRIKIFLILVFTLGITYLAYYFIFLNDEVSSAFGNSFLTVNNVFEKVDYNELVKHIEDEEVVYLFYAHPENNYSRERIKKINDIAKEKGINTIYYMEAVNFYDNIDQDDLFFGTGVQSKLEENYGDHFDYIPIVIKFENGVYSNDDNHLDGTLEERLTQIFS